MLLAALLAVVFIGGCSLDSNPVQPNSQPSLLAAASAVPADAVIDSARFYVYVSQSDTQSVQVHTANHAWNEGDVTFNSFADGFDSASVATLMLEGPGWVNVDISSQVQGWFDSTLDNYGFFIQPIDTDTGVTVFNSREAADNQPYLEIFLTTHEGSSIETYDAVADAYIYSATPDSNFGSETDLMVERKSGPDSVYQSLIRFEFPVEIRYTSIGDRVWLDENMNGLQDDGEAGMSDIEVQLYDCMGTLLNTTMTDADGMYLFDSLEAGEYQLRIVNPFGYVLTYPDEGSDDQLDSDFDRYQKVTPCFTLLPGDETMAMDAGMFAYDGCTYGKGYWKNHAGFGPQDDEVSQLLPIWLGDDAGAKSMAVEDAQTAVDILQQHTYGDPSNGITKLYAHLLTTKLNIVNFANPEDIHETVAEADAFLADHDWNDWDSLDKNDMKMVLKWKDMLEDYNEGMTGPGSCDDQDDD
jgi:hypothetical protein